MKKNHHIIFIILCIYCIVSTALFIYIIKNRESFFLPIGTKQITPTFQNSLATGYPIEPSAEPSITYGEPSEIIVENVQELFNALKSNTKILLKPGTYNLDDITSEVIIDSIENITIEGMGEDPVNLQIEDPNKIVIKFVNCKNILLKNLRIGHTFILDPGYCSAEVLYFTRCREINIEKSELYGCGAYGFVLSNVDGFNFINSVITDCSMGLLAIYNSNNIMILDSILENSGGFDLFSIDRSKNVIFDNCDIRGNEIWSFEYEHYYLFSVVGESEVKVKNSRITDNKAHYFEYGKGSVILENTILKDNVFSEGEYEYE